MNFKRLKILRVAARVIRCHTTPTIYRQSVGEHTFGALNILYTINHAPSPQLVRGLLWHDVTEAIGGDTPAPAKKYVPELGHAVRLLEARVGKEYELSGELTDHEERQLMYCDLMDLAIFAAEEADFGNAAAPVLMRRALAIIETRGIDDVTPAARELFAIVKGKMDRYDMKYAEHTINGWYHYDE